MNGLERTRGQLWFQVGQGIGVATLTGSRQLTGNSAHFQTLNPSGADQDLILPNLGPNGAGQWFVVRNSGSTYNIVIKKYGPGATVLTVTPGSWAWVASAKVSGSLDWYVMGSSVGLTSLTLTGALSAASAAFTGALSAAATTITGQLTTTDGVTSGNARIVGGNVHTKQSSTTLTNSTTETTLASHTLPANMLKAGTTLRVRGAVRVTGNAAADTLTFKLRLGGTSLVTTSAAAMVANDVAEFDFMVTSRAAPSASSSVLAEGRVGISVGGTHSAKTYVLAPTTYATNGALDVDLRGTWSAASASDVVICEAFVVDVVA